MITKSDNTNQRNIYTERHLDSLVNKIKQGAILAYPTESVWGLGCDPFNKEAVTQLLTLKNRPVEKGVILIAGSIKQVEPLLQHLPESLQQTIKKSWETLIESESSKEKEGAISGNILQAVTWLIPLIYSSKISIKNHNLELLNTEPNNSIINESKSIQIDIPDWITGQHCSVAIRVTTHPTIQKLCQKLDNFLVSTSCNSNGLEPAINLSQATHYFDNEVYYLEADTLGYTLPSKIIDACTGNLMR